MVSKQVARGSIARKPFRTVLSDETYEAIRNMLLSHDIQPGERIKIDSLAKQLDVSQTPVREALARLESDGLVLKQPLRGYASTQLLTAQQIDDLFQFRAITEPWAASAAAKNISDSGAKALRKEIEAGRAAGELGASSAYAAMSEHDARFHELIAKESGSAFVYDAFARTHCHLHLFRLYKVLETWMSESRGDAILVGELFKLYYQPEGGFLAFREHEAIAAAILSRESDQAQKLMLEHIESSRQRFKPIMEAIRQGSLKELGSD